MVDTVATEKSVKFYNLFLVKCRALSLNKVLYHILFISYVTYQSLKNFLSKN